MPDPKPGTPNTASKTVGKPSWYANSDNNKGESSVTNEANQLSHTNRDQGASATSNDQSTNGRNSNHDHMKETTVRLGSDFYTIKGYVVCREQELFALECERQITGYNGACPVCHVQHVPLSKSRGYYAPIANIYGAIGNQNAEEERSKGRKKRENLISIKGNRPPLTSAKFGKNKGIEGDSNSCYMDSTIFCMFAYSEVFDSLLNMNVANNESLAKLQNLLRENIVNLLRSDECFVERDALFNLRVLLSEATNDQTFQEVEKDPSEFLRAFERLFQYTPLNTIPSNQPPNKDGSNIIKNIIWEMFDANPDRLPKTNIAGIFRNSLLEIQCKLATIPSVLILMAPRHTRSQRSYRYIIPDREITLDNKMVQLVCINCTVTNDNSEPSREFYFCQQCFSKDSCSAPTPSINAAVMCYCEGCVYKLHKLLSEKDRLDHHPKSMKEITYKLNLFAVLCIETSHYVAFVKCHKANQQHEWIFFDSMSDRINNSTNVPCVRRVPDFDEWIKEAENNDNYFEDLDRRRNQRKPTSQVFDEVEMWRLRLFRDGAFFFYENPVADYQ